MQANSLKKLRAWFAKNAAELPWRLLDLDEPRDPYAVWISETMLQQTQVSTVKEYFIRWMEHFPNIATLAKASEEEVFKYWQGLGYYSRARNILRTAQRVAASCGKNLPQMPSTRKELEALPGIGAYTAGAILSLAYHQREAILDGNLIRIFARLYALNFLPTEDKNSAEIYWNYAREIADSPKAYMHNEAFMELGRTVCKVKNPECEKCPLKMDCKSFAAGTTAQFPPPKKHVQKDWYGAVLVVESSDHQILTIHGNQKFFNNQFALPHFESSPNAASGLPAVAENLINADQIQEVTIIGQIKHSITVHKITCKVFHVQMKVPVTKLSVDHPDFRWIEKAKTRQVLANSFSLKALDLI